MWHRIPRGFSGIRYININEPELKNVLGLMREPQFYWLFKWKHRHKAWFETKPNVFFDFGHHDLLYRLKSRTQTSFVPWHVQEVKKSEFIRKYSG